MVFQALVAPPINSTAQLPTIPGVQLQLEFLLVNTSFALPRAALASNAAPPAGSRRLQSHAASPEEGVPMERAARELQQATPAPAPAGDPCSPALVAAQAAAIARAAGLPVGNVTISCKPAQQQRRRGRALEASGDCAETATWSVSLAASPMSDASGVASVLSRCEAGLVRFSSRTTARRR